MAKIKTAYYCQNCGAQAAKWIGKCPACGEWNTYVEEIIQNEATHKLQVQLKASDAKPLKIDEITKTREHRVSTHNKELDRVLGGGLVDGSLILTGGEPGIGKSTLMLQIALQMPDTKVLYISGEESAEQIKMRAERLKLVNPECYILTEHPHKIYFNI